MQKAAKEKSFILWIVASVALFCAPSFASSVRDLPSENRVEIFLLGGQNRTGQQAFDTVNRVENYDSAWGVALESPVAPKGVVGEFAEGASSRVRIEGNRVYALQPSNGGTGPNRWMRMNGGTSGNTTRLGVPRTNAADWRGLRDVWDRTGVGDILSPANRQRIADGVTPRVDGAWTRHFPGDADLIDELIPMHHIQGTPITVPLPASRHLDAHMPGGFRFNPGGPGRSG